MNEYITRSIEGNLFITIGLLLTPLIIVFGLFYNYNNRFKNWFNHLFYKEENKGGILE